MSHQGDYIKRVLKERKITQEQLANDIEVSRGQIINVLKNIVLKEDSIGTVSKILAYLKLSSDNLPTVTEAEKIAFLRGILNNVNDKVSSGEQNVDTNKKVLGANDREIPVYNDKAAGSAVEIYNDESEYEPAFTVKIPQFSDCDFGKMLFGNSMYPTYESGSYLFMKKISELRQVAPGEVYYIETRYLKVAKRLQLGSSEDHFLALSDNEEKRPDGGLRYEPFPIYKEDILALFIVKGSIRQNQN